MSILSKFARLLSGDAEVPISDESHRDTPTFIPENRLEHLLIAAATDPSMRPEFNRELLSQNLFVATPVAPEETGQGVLETDEVLQILNIGSSDGMTLPAVFSSGQRLAECFGAGTGYVAMKGETLLGIVQKDGLQRQSSPLQLQAALD